MPCGLAKIPSEIGLEEQEGRAWDNHNFWKVSGESREKEIESKSLNRCINSSQVYD